MATREQLRKLSEKSQCRYLDFDEDTVKGNPETHSGSMQMFSKECGFDKVGDHPCLTPFCLSFGSWLRPVVRPVPPPVEVHFPSDDSGGHQASLSPSRGEGATSSATSGREELSAALRMVRFPQILWFRGFATEWIVYLLDCAAGLDVLVARQGLFTV